MARQLSYDEHKRWLDLSRTIIPQAYQSSGPARTPVRPSSRARSLRADQSRRAQQEQEAIRRLSAGVGRPGRFADLAQRVAPGGGPGDFARDEPSMTPREQARFDREQAQRWRDRTAAESKRRGTPDLATLAKSARRYFDEESGLPRNYSLDGGSRPKPLRKLTAAPMRDGARIDLGGYSFRGGSQSSRFDRNAGPTVGGDRMLRNTSGRRVVENATMDDALAMADQIGRRNDYNRRGLEILGRLGGIDAKTLADLQAKYRKNPSAVGLFDSIQESLQTRLTGLRDAKIAAIGDIGSIGAGRKRVYEGPMERDGIIAVLEERGRQRLKAAAPLPPGVAPDRLGFSDAEIQAAGGIGAAAAAAAGRQTHGYGGRSGGIGRMTYNATSKSTATGVVGSERGSVYSTSSGGFYTSGDSPANAGARAFRGALQAIRGYDRGDRFAMYGVSGKPIFAKPTPGGSIDTVSELERAYNRDAANLRDSRTKLYNDWLMSSEGQEYQREKRLQHMLKLEKDRAEANVRNQFQAYDEAARFFGFVPKTVSSPVVQEPAESGVAGVVNPSDGNTVDGQYWMNQEEKDLEAERGDA